MASGTITGSTGNQYIDCKIEWSSTATNSSNSSKVTASLMYKRNNSGYETYGTGSFSITINGVKASASKVLTITESDWVTAVSSTVTVNHNTDGTKAITISGTGSMPSTSLSSTSCSGTATLDTIPRASTLSYASNTVLNNICTVRWTPYSKTFYYKIKFEVGDWSLTTAAIYPQTTSLYTNASYGISIDAANQFPNSDSAEMTVTLYTYSDKDCTKQMGDPSSKTCRVTLPENDDTRPTLEMGLSAVNSISNSAFSGLYIQNKSKVKATLTAEGRYSATIKSYNLNVAGKNYSSPYESNILGTTGTVSVVGSATDSRGFTKSVSQNIYVIPYSRPALIPYSGYKGIVCERCTEDGTRNPSGTYLNIKAKRQYSKVTVDGTQKNFCALRFRYKTESSSVFTEWKTLLDKSNVSTDEVDVVLGNVVSSTTTSYVVQISVTDDVGESSTPFEFNIPTAQVTMHFRYGGKGVAIGKYSEEDNLLDIAEDWDVNARGNLTVGGILSAKNVQHLGAIDNYHYKDFNDLVFQTGYYTGSSVPSSTSCSNYPINETGVLEVISTILPSASSESGWWGFAYQTYRDNLGNIFTRSYLTSRGWTEWKKVTLT